MINITDTWLIGSEGALNVYLQRVYEFQYYGSIWHQSKCTLPAPAHSQFIAVTVEIYSPKYNVNSAHRAKPGPDNTIIDSLLLLLFQLFSFSIYLPSKWNAFTPEEFCVRRKTFFSSSRSNNHNFISIFNQIGCVVTLFSIHVMIR